MLADKRIRTRSFPNVETARLTARLEFVRVNLRAMSVDISREDFRSNVREIVNVERELMHRGVMFRPVTNGVHLRVSTSEVRHIGPFTRADTPYANRPLTKG